MRDKCKMTITIFDSGSENDENSMDESYRDFRQNLRRRYERLFNNINALEKAFSSYSRLQSLGKEHEELIHILHLLQETFESPSEEDFKRVTAFSLGVREEDCVKRIQHVTEIIILTVKLIVDFSKGVPGFETLSPQDQITLLKACSIEIMLLRLARKYDLKTKSTVFGNNRPYTRENFCSACMGDFANFIFEFCRTMCKLKVDNTEYALLTAIVIFSNQPYLLEPKKVQRFREIYIETLKAYIDISRPAGNDYFDQLISTLADLRKLSKKNSQQWLSLKVYYNKLPPLLEELLGIQ